MIKKHTDAEKLVCEYTGGDPAPTWENKLKNQMGYAQMSDLANKIHGKGNKNPGDDAEQLLSDLGKKSTTINTGPDKAASGKKIV
jgi:hypothetical protein